MEWRRLNAQVGVCVCVCVCDACVRALCVLTDLVVMSAQSNPVGSTDWS